MDLYTSDFSRGKYYLKCCFKSSKVGENGVFKSVVILRFLNIVIRGYFKLLNLYNCFGDCNK